MPSQFVTQLLHFLPLQCLDWDFQFHPWIALNTRVETLQRLDWDPYSCVQWWIMNKNARIMPSLASILLYKQCYTKHYLKIFQLYSIALIGIQICVHWRITIRNEVHSSLQHVHFSTTFQYFLLPVPSKVLVNATVGPPPLISSTTGRLPITSQF